MHENVCLNVWSIVSSAFSMLSSLIRCHCWWPVALQLVRPLSSQRCQERRQVQACQDKWLIDLTSGKNICCRKRTSPTLPSKSAWHVELINPWEDFSIKCFPGAKKHIYQTAQSVKTQAAHAQMKKFALWAVGSLGRPATLTALQDNRMLALAFWRALTLINSQDANRLH